MWTNLMKTTDLFTFTKEILNFVSCSSTLRETESKSSTKKNLKEGGYFI